jgi:predicted lipoprotein with Yx(FWY)xxD motif
MRNRPMRSLAMAISIAALLAGACGEDDGSGTAQGPTEADSPTAGTSAPAEPATVSTAESDLGTILVDADGMTLYLFEQDTGDASTCYGECEAAWPPLVAEDPTAGDGVDEGKLGTTTRDDGSVQVTYDGHPLYYFASDGAPGDTQGQGIGDVWFVVDPTGKAVKEKAGRPGY